MKKTKYLSLALVFTLGLSPIYPVEAQKMDHQSLLEDLDFLQSELGRLSAYYDLHAKSIDAKLEDFSANLPLQDAITTTTFGIFLSNTLDELGDRHARVRIPNLPNTQFLPFVVAPLGDRVLALRPNREIRQYELFSPNFPYLRSINGEPINTFLHQISPMHRKAPSLALHSRGVKALKYMEENYAIMEQPLPTVFSFVFESKDRQSAKAIRLPLETNRRKYRTWGERFYQNYQGLDDDEFNQAKVIESLFSTKDDIAYVQIPAMVQPHEAPDFFNAMGEFIERQKDSKALIIDVRNNGGGGRALIWKLASYIVHPDSIHVVNIARQKAPLPLSAEWQRDLTNRYLYPLEAYDQEAQGVIKRFMQRFKPSVSLSTDKFSDFHFALFDGRKRNEGKPHYKRPVYILMNERSFSAASVLAATFRGLPNVTLVGEQTDGSSGNSEWIRLPNSQIRVKLSTMISFQKDGQLLDGFGTEPDIQLSRNLEQVLWQKDTQLLELKKIIAERAVDRR